MKLIKLLLASVCLMFATTAAADDPGPLKSTTEYWFVGHLGQFDDQGRLLAWEGNVSGDIDGMMGTIELMRGNHDQAVTLAEKAVALNPSGADVAAILGWILSYSGNYERSILMIRSAMRLSPYYADWYRWVLGRSYRLAGQVKNAIGVLGRSPDDTPQSLAPDVELATAYSQIGDLAEARKRVKRVLEIDPDFSARALAKLRIHWKGLLRCIQAAMFS